MDCHRAIDTPRLLLCALAVVFLGCAGLTGCAQREGGQAGQEKQLIFITNGDSPFWDAAEKGWLEEAEKRGMKAQFLRNKSGDAAGQIRLLEQVASRSNVGGLAISIVDVSAAGINDRLEAIGKKAPVVTVDSDTSAKHKELRRAYIGTNNAEAGKVAGRIATKLLPDGGKWIGFVGNADADNARARIEGFEDGIGDSFERIDIMQDQHDAGKARENVRAAVAKDVDLMFGIYSYNAPAIAEVVDDAGEREETKVVTFDAEANTIQAIEKGQIDATVVQNTYDMGAAAVQLLEAFGKEDTATIQEILGDGDELDTKVRVIVPDDSKLEDPLLQKVSDFKKYMESMGLKST